MTKTKFDETYIFKISIKSDSFDISFSIEIPFFRVSFTIEPGRSLLQFVTTNCLNPYSVKFHSNCYGNIPTRLEVCQGGVLWPYLFSICIRSVLYKIMPFLFCNLVNVSCIAYADDILLDLAVQDLASRIPYHLFQNISKLLVCHWILISVST